MKRCLSQQRKLVAVGDDDNNLIVTILGLEFWAHAEKLIKAEGREWLESV